jgi:ribonucleoside-diphosphate reductase alpha chain
MYSYDEAYKASLEYFNGDELASKVFVDKYALRDNEDNLLELTPTDMHWRLANEFARIEKSKYVKALTKQEIFDLLDHFKYIVPQGSILYGCGNYHQYVSISNCFLTELPLDSYASILRTDEQLVNISKRRGGCGVNISNLRPNGSPTKNAARTSTGIIPFMERYSNSIREVGQNSRRGALLIALNCHHPQVLDFIKVKNDRTKVTGANISLLLTDEFMSAVEKDEKYELRFPIDSKVPKFSKMVKAREVWNEIVKNAHEHAEPGLVFYDTIKKYTPADCYPEYKSEGLNPCAELNLSPLDSCRLLLLNLFSYVVNPFTKSAYFDYKLFYQHAQLAQRLMDDVVDLEAESVQSIIDKVNSDPEPLYIKRNELDMWAKILKNCVEGRRTGTGLTGLADTLAGLNVKYDSVDGITYANEIYKTLQLGCYRSSVDMAKELGAFKIWDKELEKDHLYLTAIKDKIIVLNEKECINGEDIYNDMQKYGRRNIALLTSSPAGSMSCLTQTSSGLEPCFKLKYTRRKKGNPGDNDFRVDFVDKSGDSWMEFDIFHHKLQMWMDITGKTDIKESPWYNCCAEDIRWQKRIELQSIIQKHICHSISSTINLPESVSIDIVKQIYEEAWKSQLKGITVYRQNSRTGVLVSKEVEVQNKRPREIPCDVHHVMVKGSQYVVLIGLLNNRPYEIFACKNNILPNKIKTGKIIRKRQGFYKAVFDGFDEELAPITSFCDNTEEAITRLSSALLRNGNDINLVITQLEKVGGNNAEIHSFVKSIAKALKKYIPDNTEIEGELCPECGGKLIRVEGCKSCSCGWSKC